MKGNLFRKEQWTVRFHLTCLASSQVAFTFPSCYENIYNFSTRWFLKIGCDISICAWFNKGWTCLNLFIYISYLREYLFNNNENDKCSPELINYILVNNRLGEDQVTVQESSNLTFDMFCWLYSDLLFLFSCCFFFRVWCFPKPGHSAMTWITQTTTNPGVSQRWNRTHGQWHRESDCALWNILATIHLALFYLKNIMNTFHFPSSSAPLPQVTSWPLTSAARLRSLACA